MNTLVVVAVCGRAGAGKDAFARAFLQEGYVCVKFASVLKSVVRTLFPGYCTHEHTDGALKDVTISELGASPRQLMQYIGTDLLQLSLGRQFPAIGRKVFCAPTIAEVGRHERCVITDMRFKHEYDALVEATTLHCARLYVVRIERGEASEQSKASEQSEHSEANHYSQSDHVSETEYASIPVDTVVQNTGSLDDLHRRAAEVQRDICEQGRG